MAKVVLYLCKYSLALFWGAIDLLGHSLILLGLLFGVILGGTRAVCDLQLSIPHN